jgi:hypothetical protein
LDQEGRRKITKVMSNVMMSAFSAKSFPAHFVIPFIYFVMYDAGTHPALCRPWGHVSDLEA